MTVREFYQEIGGDYELMCHRLPTEELIRQFLMDFLEVEEFSRLSEAMSLHEDQKAFEAAHSLKGVAKNMELGRFSNSITELTEALRNGRKPEADALFLTAKADYEDTIRAIRSLE